MRSMALVAFMVAACAKPGGAVPAVEDRGFAVLAINDVYRIEGLPEASRGGLARVRALREQLEAEGEPVLLLHGGDFLYPSLLSRTYDGAQMIDVMNRLDGAAGVHDERMFVVPGNHEFDKSKIGDASTLQARIAESEFTWLSANVHFSVGEGGEPLVQADNLVPRTLVRVDGVDVGLFGVTTDKKVPAYVDGIDGALETVRRETAQLREHGADVVIALTHLDASDDRQVLEALPAPEGPDLIVGGHDHQAIVEQVGGRWLLKADADALTATVVRVRVSNEITIRPELVALGPEQPQPDPEVQAVVDDWVAKHRAEWCTKKELDPTCLDVPIGLARTELVGEELEIRRFETSLGNFVADRALAAYASEGAQVAFVNSGGLRLNRNIPAGAQITRRHLEELLPYPTSLRVIDIPGRMLIDEILPHAISDWTGNGHWLQVAGMGFTHDPAAGTVSDVWILDGGQRRPIRPDEMIRAVTVEYVVDPNIGDQDGYRMLNPSQVVGGGKALKEVVLEAVRAAGADGVAPGVDGRICNTQRQTCPPR